MLGARVRRWRNWYTRQLEVLVGATPWKFESSSPHHFSLGLSLGLSTYQSRNLKTSKRDHFDPDRVQLDPSPTARSAGPFSATTASMSDTSASRASCIRPTSETRFESALKTKKNFPA